MKDDKDSLHNLRHTLAHLLARAVEEHYPEAQPTIGPPTDDGFYYDFDFGETDFGEDDLKKIEKTMKKLLPSWTAFEAKEVTPDEAREAFEGNEYKKELIDELEDEGATITFYTAGDFTDLCRGGHLKNPAEEINPNAFKLDRIAGAYWRGDENNTMLTRIYGLAFETPEELKEYKGKREEAKKRDHRKLGKELDLFTFSDLIGPGLPLFTPKGTLLRDLIVEKIHDIQEDFGYDRVTIPHISKKDLFETSGHWEKFGDELFRVKGKGDSDFDFVMKPMNCPLHTQIYASRQRSYRDLPIRYTEATMVYRDEQAGELLGLSRVRAITQDDGHVFCTEEQAEEEILNIVKVIEQFYTSLGMWNDDTFWVSLSVRDPEKPEEYLGEDTRWERAEETLKNVAEKAELPFKRIEGEAAFYGPKLDFMFKDALGREWQLGTAQYDLNMPGRFGLVYTDANGEEKTPVMIHRAIAGSLERFLSVIIEHFAGKFPLWLSPVQVKVLPIGEDHREYAESVAKELGDAGIRVEVDTSDNTLGKKIRVVKMEKVPYFLVIGDNEVEGGNVTVESRDEGKVGVMKVEELIDKLESEV
ncbi:MAG: threonine--tRNA ligase, partial [Candidatus Paceibacterota bacterium]